MGGGKLALAQKAKAGGKSSAKKAGLTFPSPRVKRYMKQGRYAERMFYSTTYFKLVKFNDFSSK